MDKDEKRWELMKQLLGIEARGDAPLRFSSQRTLFGIPSHVETVIQRTVDEENERLREKRRRDREIGAQEGDGEQL